MSVHGVIPEGSEPISMQEMLQNIPPGETREVSGGLQYDGALFRAVRVDLSLHCDDDICGRVQTFGCITESAPPQPLGFLVYLCKNCNHTTKTFALRFERRKGNDCIVTKIGEFPRYSKPLPAKLQRLVQPKRELLIKGFRSENQGLGIGAFAYYRRLVEDEKNALIDEISKACRNVAGGEAFIPILAQARKEVQFSNALKNIGDVIPDALRISGHNPFTVLHQALSSDLHTATDEECLAAAGAIRLVLVELSERMASISAENVELEEALKKLAGKSKGPAKNKDANDRGENASTSQI